MIYILGANLKDTQPVHRSLCKVYGINIVLSHQICDDLGISQKIRTSQLLASQIDFLNQIVPQDYLVGSQLHTQSRQGIERLIGISSYKGIRHSQGLPTRGQRTHGNAQTSRKRLARIFQLSQQKGKASKGKKG
jgi:small subunit ribosomal protein S13